MDYIDRIKQLKSQKKITNDELSVLTGIPLGTLSKILAGISDSPKLSNIVAICDALGCSVDYIISGKPENNNNYTLEQGEIRLVENYRRLDSHGREMVTLVLEKECERQRAADYGTSDVNVTPRRERISGAKVLKMPNRVNEYVESEGSVKGFGKRPIPLYDLPVSAGAGVFLDVSSADEIVIPDNARTAGADFAVRISGRSMEPRYRDGDILLVQDCDTVENGDLGIFVLDGAGYFQKYGGDRLISLNPEFGEILLKDFDEILCCGKVIGKLKKK